MAGRISKKRYIGIYTVVFALLFFICVLVWFLIYNKTFFRYDDGLNQHYLIFVYIGRWIREIANNIFILHKPEVPLWEPGMGYGADIPTTLGAYLPDPFNWISAFFPESVSEYGFNLSILLKFYFTGLTFSYFAYKKNCAWHYCLAGTIIYLFSGTMMIAFIESFFINPMYIFPLLLLSTDRLIEKKKGVAFSLMLAWAFINYFYFAYMMCILLAGYIFLHFVFLDSSEKKLRRFFNILPYFILYSIIGVAISAVVTLPIVFVLLKTGRLGVSYYMPYLYSGGYYKSFYAGFTSNFSMMGRDCIIGYGGIAIVCVFALFLSKGYHKLKTEFIAMTIGLLIPFVGHVMNGLSYPANRWVWAYTLCVAFIVCIMLPQLYKLSKKRLCIILCLSTSYFVSAQLILGNISWVLTTEMILVIGFLVFLIINRVRNRKKTGFLSILFCAASVFIINYFLFNSNYGNETNNKVTFGTAYSLINNNGAIELLDMLEKTDTGRYDEFKLWRIKNASWLKGHSGADLYISIYNNRVDRFHNDMGIICGTYPADYHGLDRRSEIECLLGVDYYISANNDPTNPYFYSNIIADAEVYENPYYMYESDKDYSIMYGYNKIISKNEFDKLSFHEKSQALMQVIYADENDTASNSTTEDINFSGEVLKYKVLPDSDVKIEDGKVIVSQDNANITLEIDNNPEDSEYYIEGKDITFLSGGQLVTRIDVNVFSEGESNIDGMGGELDISTPYSHMHGGKSGWIMHLGHTEKKVNNIVLTFKKAGVYTFDKFSITRTPKSDLEKSVLSPERVEKESSYFNNGMTAKVNMSQDEHLFMSIPYSTGWTVKVDGKETDYFAADEAFMAFPVAKGVHNIELTYITPGLKSGTACTVIGIVILIIVSIIRKNKERIQITK